MDKRKNVVLFSQMFSCSSLILFLGIKKELLRRTCYQIFFFALYRHKTERFAF